MIRSQVLLTPNLREEIKRIAKKQNVSQSELIRKYLSQALVLNHSTFAAEGEAKNDLPVVTDLTNYTSSNPRIDGFRELYTVGAKTNDIKILPHSVFRLFLDNGKLPAEVQFHIKKAADEIKDLSVTKTLALRRAYVVPGIENPPGPRFLGLQSDEVIHGVEEIYQFAMAHDYHKSKHSQICAFFYPFADPKPVTLPIRLESVVPYGGYAVPLNETSSRVEVLAVWGNNEGVQSFDSIDRYIVDTERKIILEKNIPQKMVMFCTTEHSQSEKVDVPLHKQFEQVLSDVEILEAARIVSELTRKYGLRRVEFSFDGRKEIIFNESVPYEINPRKNIAINRKGTIMKIVSDTDIHAIRAISGDKAESTILLIDRSIVENRSYDILNSVAALPHKFVVLYPGLSATAHAMRVLSDFGHTAITIGTRLFNDGEEVIIKSKDGHITIDPITKENLKDYVVNLHDALLYSRSVVGGKALNLSILKAKGFNVPHGAVLTTNLTAESNDVLASIWPKIEASMSLKKTLKYAVRSSANVEDGSEYSFAGQFDSFLNVSGRDIKSRVHEVLKSVEKSALKAYMEVLKKPEAIKMAVIVQEMIDADKSGVVFGKDVQTGDDDLIVIDVTKGLASGVVEGTAKTHRVVYSRMKDKIISETNGNDSRLLTRLEVDALVEMVQSIENLMGETQDIEWAIDKKGSIWIIQTRGISS